MLSWTESRICEPNAHAYEEVGKVGHMTYSICNECYCGRIQYSRDDDGIHREYLYKHEMLDSQIIIGHIGWISGCWRYNGRRVLPETTI